MYESRVSKNVSKNSVAVLCSLDVTYFLSLSLSVSLPCDTSIFPILLLPRVKLQEPA